MPKAKTKTVSKKQAKAPARKAGHKRKANLLTKVVSFRVSIERRTQLEESFAASKDGIVNWYRPSMKTASNWARKIVSDYLAGRLVYPDARHILADYDANEQLDD